MKILNNEICYDCNKHTVQLAGFDYPEMSGRKKAGSYLCLICGRKDWDWIETIEGLPGQIIESDLAEFIIEIML